MTIEAMHDVLIKALRSLQAEDCDLKPLTWAASRLSKKERSRATKERGRTSVLVLRESTRAVRKPYREPSSFDEGDRLHLVGVRSQLSNVPTKVLFSRVAASAPRLRPGSSRPARKEAKEAELLQSWGIFLDWRRRRSWLAIYREGVWVKQLDLHEAASFPFELGETFELSVNRSATGFHLAARNLSRFIPTAEAITRVNQVSIRAMPPHPNPSVYSLRLVYTLRHTLSLDTLRLPYTLSVALWLELSPARASCRLLDGSAVERATISYAGAHWRALLGQTCVNEAREKMIPGARVPRTLSYAACREACAATGPACTGFAFSSGAEPSAILSGALHHLRVEDSAKGECRLQGALKTKTISACEMSGAAHWELQLKIVRQVTCALVAPQAARSATRQLITDRTHFALGLFVLFKAGVVELDVPSRAS